jgi:hypothetical protein
MTTLIRWLLAACVVAGGLVVVPAAPVFAAPVSAAPVVLDEVQLRYLPAGLGGSTDFVYGFDDVDFVSRVWESGSDEDGWRVDLDAIVMRGDRLTNGKALHDWFIAYEERPPAAARYVPVRVHGRPGWMCRDQVFWLVRPGLAVSVQLDRTRWSRHEVARIARSARVLD